MDALSFTVNRALIFLLTLVNLTAFGQHGEKSEKLMSSVSIFAGLVHVRTTDVGLSFNRLLLSGTGVPLSVRYELEAPKHMTEFHFDYYNVALSHKKANIPASLTHGLLSLTHTRSIQTFNLGSKRLRVLVGLRLGTNINYLESASLDNDDVLVINALHIVVKSKVTLDESKTLTLSVALPTIALTKRLVFDGGLHEPASDDSKTMQILYRDSKLVFANSCAFSAEYAVKLSTIISWVSTYNFNYLTNNNMEPLKIYTNELISGFRFNLKK
ncbi:MAG TPA: hypothetical protein VE467_16345 [Chryseolinea sp.]|nr:hypothetical protein [Chryseolinea sp.]